MCNVNNMTKKAWEQLITSKCTLKSISTEVRLKTNGDPWTFYLANGKEIGCWVNGTVYIDTDLGWKLFPKIAYAKYCSERHG